MNVARADAPVILDESEWIIPSFSKFDDRNGYNGRVISSGQFDQILNTYFLHRKPTQEAKMLQQECTVLKIDFEYKLPPRVWVYQGRGKCFQPYTCMATVQNQNNQTVYWKVCSGSEAIDEIAGGLQYIASRNNVKVVYVDNAKTSGRKLLEIFPNAEVKEDPFHFMKRMDEIAFDKKSESWSIFRGLMSRVVFNCNPDKYDRAEKIVKAKLVKSKKLQERDKPT